ncbi:MAG TPA: WGxxGxxG family protein [Actinomycetota bacterium]|nr:WGxxGxxG family protein [Actinomycetota bacterium]
MTDDSSWSSTTEGFHRSEHSQRSRRPRVVTGHGIGGLAQDTGTDVVEEATNDNGDTGLFGLVGLLGLAGLFGLKRRDDHVRRDRTDIRRDRTDANVDARR